MSFNNGKERRQFEKQQSKLANEYRDAGMSETDIQAMYEFDLAVFRGNRREREHAVDSLEMMTVGVGVVEQCCMDIDELMDTHSLVSSVNRYAWIDELENQQLFNAIASMKADYIEIITLLMEGHAQVDIAVIMHSSFRAINNKVARIRNHLKEFAT